MSFSVFKPFASRAPDMSVEPGHVVWDRALDCPETAAAVSGWWFSAAAPAVLGLVLLGITGADVKVDSPSNWQILGVGLVIAGLATVVFAWSARQKLGRGAWVVWPAMFVKPPAPFLGRPLIVLVEPSGASHVLSTSSRTPLWEAMANTEGWVWFCGDPNGAGVVSFPGGSKPVPARRPVVRRAAKQDAARAALAAATA